jgi:hypothetical protein
MSSEIQTFLNKPYSPLLLKRDGKFYLYQNELSLIVEHENLAATYELLEKEKRSYFEKMIRLGLTNSIPEPAPLSAKNKVFAELGIFFTKTVVAGLAAVLILLFFIPAFSALVRHEIKSIANLNPYGMPFQDLAISLPKQLNEKMGNIAPQKLAEIKKELRGTVQNLKPFLDELYPLLPACSRQGK